MDLRRLLAGLLASLLLLSAALADPARVLTPGGSVKMRRTADDKGRLVTNVPNHSLVEVEEEGETWCKVTYRGKSGYIKSEFLLLPSALPGKTVYPDEGSLVLRMTASEGAQIVAAVSQAERVTAVSVRDGWVLVRAEGAILNGVEGYVPLEQLSWQRTEPAGPADWVPEAGLVVTAAGLRLNADETSPELAALQPGDAVTVTLIRDGMCLALADGRLGWLPASAVCLNGPEDAQDAPDIDPEQRTKAEQAAVKALAKAHKGFDANQYYIDLRENEETWECSFFDAGDAYRWLVLVDKETGAATVTADYTAFASPARTRPLLAHGELRVTLSADAVGVGDVVDITVDAWTATGIGYELSFDGKIVAAASDTDHRFASYRVREAGEYTLKVTVTDEKGLSRSQTLTFTGDPDMPVVSDPLHYSQKDGSWARTPYRDRTLEQSGCAIFALSHALHRMGIEGEDTEPAALAKAYALCLTDTGTNNERLLREAGAKFGFTTRSALIGDGREITRRLQAGEMFSFAIVRGHIALIDGISEDGMMVHIVDSAPSATMERLEDGVIYAEARAGILRPVESLDAIPGARWYFETDSYGCLEYWMPLSYAVRRGVRVIQPAPQEIR